MNMVRHCKRKSCSVMWKEAVMASFEVAPLSKLFTGLTERNKENPPTLVSFFRPRLEPITL
jgi:hypothetical protein